MQMEAIMKAKPVKETSQCVVKPQTRKTMPADMKIGEKVGEG